PCTSYLLLTASLLLILLNCSSSPSPPPPSSTLFPYTTLFRSPEYVTERVLGGAIDHQPHGPIAVVLADQYQRTGEVRISQRRQGDRKSTRLNSSHVSISYAVFCLKKKNAVIGLTSAPAAHDTD